MSNLWWKELGIGSKCLIICISEYVFLEYMITLSKFIRSEITIWVVHQQVYIVNQHFTNIEKVVPYQPPQTYAWEYLGHVEENVVETNLLNTNFMIMNMDHETLYIG